jgi:hypothetical protein
LLGLSTSTKVRAVAAFAEVACPEIVKAVPDIEVTVDPAGIFEPDTRSPTLIEELAAANVIFELLSIVEPTAVVPPTKLFEKTCTDSPWQISSSCLPYASAGYASLLKSHRSTWLTFLSTTEKQLSISLSDF